jgi:hypothetical protein
MVKEPVEVAADEVPFPPVLNVATPERLTPRTVVWKVPSFGKNVPLLIGLPFPPLKAWAKGEVRTGSARRSAKNASEDTLREERRPADVFI